MSFGYSRPHSTDSWRSRRPSFELSSRMHSVPRNIKSTNRHTGGNYSSEFNFESPLYYMHRNDSSSMSRESLSPRNSRCSYDEDFTVKYPQKSYDKELQRKMTFNLHEEIVKPYLTIVLEEICDPDRINDICLNTLTSMMRSKTYRKFLHHMNNSAIPSQHNDITHNSGKTKMTGKQSKGAKDASESGGSAGVSAMIKTAEVPNKKFLAKQQASEKEKTALNDLPKQYDEYRTQTLINRKRRQDEINALEKLKGKLPPVKKASRAYKDGAEEDNEKEKEKEKVQGPSKSKSMQLKFGSLIKSASVVTQQPTKENTKAQAEDADTVSKKEKKGLGYLSAEETLRTKWLRLTEDQIADLEAEIIASGRDPGIHDFCKANINDVFKKISYIYD